jgi:hypothetical protein
MKKIAIAAFLAVLAAGANAQDHSWFPGPTWLPPTGGDITIPDGTIVSPGQKIEKIWLIINDGDYIWEGRRLKRASATQGLVVPEFVKMPYAKKNLVAKVETSDHKVHSIGGGCLIKMTFTAPMQEGDYEAEFKQVDAKGALLFPNKRGLTVKITVKKKS